jgi:S-adenosylmethionine:tRNA ribosyltransferase-isomerase
MCPRVVLVQRQRCVPSPCMAVKPIKTDDLDFELPKELIATKPMEPRDSSRLLVVQRSKPDRIEHRRFTDLPLLLEPEDLLVFNRSRVVPARLVGENAANTGGGFEGLYLHEIESSDTRPTWIAMIRAKRTKPGKRYRLFDANHQPTEIILELLEKHAPEGPGAWKVAVVGSDQLAAQSAEQVLELVGHTPLPPYIVNQRKVRDEDPGDAYDRSHYQTVYASEAESGSVAAPTAGLHFTPAVFDELKARSVRTSEVTLHVGAGTFKPVETDTLDAHPMHAEICSMGNSEALFPPRSNRRTIAVGSTSARTLESYAQLHDSNGRSTPEIPRTHSTRILISPGYQWQWVDGMVTNFHLPRSTLLAMVASMLDLPGEADGLERIKEIYAQAIHEKYRFFSYGDAMLILP